jgi:hypothetical protein
MANDALQTWDPGLFLQPNENRGPGSAVHRFALHCVRDTKPRAPPYAGGTTSEKRSSAASTFASGTPSSLRTMLVPSTSDTHL